MAWTLSDDFVKGILGTPATNGSFATLLAYGYIELWSGTRNTDPNGAMNGTLLATITLNGSSFTPGTNTNGLNVGVFSGLTMKRAIDPATSVTEVWQGDGLAAAGTGTTAQSCRWYENDGGSISCDGVIATSGGDLTLSSTTIVEGVTVNITDVAITLLGS